MTGGSREALADLGRQALHAYLLGIEHPVSGGSLLFRSQLPADLARLRTELARGLPPGRVTSAHRRG